MKKGLTTNSVKRNFSTILSIINLIAHPWRSFKTKGSQGQIPQVGASLWVAKKIKNNPDHTFAFPI